MPLHLQFLFLRNLNEIFIYLFQVWLRQLLVVNGIFPGIDLVCMVRLIGPYIISFGFLYIRIYIPFLLLFWALYSGSRVPQEIMKTNWRECESIVYQVPYTGSQPLNISFYSSVCQQSVNVDGFANFYDSIYSVFRFIVVDNYDFASMKLVQNELSPILSAIFIILSSVIGLNFFIGLMSNVLSEQAYNMVDSHKSMELLGYILQIEWRMNRKRRQRHLDTIKRDFSPKVKIQKSNRNIAQSNYGHLDPKYHNHGHHLNEEGLAENGLKFQDLQVSSSESIDKINQRLDDLKHEFRELKELLKAKSNK